MSSSSLPQYQREVETFGLGARVRLLGRVDDVSAYLAAPDLFVLPAGAEGLSNALLEAMAMAVPGVASRVSGNIELIEDGVSGWLFDFEGGAKAVRAALQAALSTDLDTRREIGRAGRLRVERNHKIGRVADRPLLVPSQEAAA